MHSPAYSTIFRHCETMERKQTSRAIAAAATPVRGQVETSLPYRSVKEAVAVYGERLLLGDSSSQKADSTENPAMPIYALPPPKPVHSEASSPRSYSSSQFVQDIRDDGDHIILNALRKLEVEMEEAKRELMLLKERESKTEIAVATIRAQLQKSTPMLAEIEQVKGAESKLQKASGEQTNKVRSGQWHEEGMGEFESSFQYMPSLAQALSIASEMDEDEFSVRRRIKVAKRKPIVPLVGDIFSYKKKESTADHLSRSICSRSSFSVLS